MKMKINTKYLLSLLYLINSSIIQSKADVVITDEELGKFAYGQEEFKMAIIGDSGTEREAKKVMELRTDYNLLLHLGDFDYGCHADKYFDEILDHSRKYQFMGILGNHEGASQCGSDIHRKFTSNVHYEMTHSTRNSRVKCYFSDSKKMWSCKYKNMRVIGLSAGVNGADSTREQLSFLKEQLSKATEDWKICAWHFYDEYYHTGKYPDDKNLISRDGESFYDYCKDHGAIIFSAHDHVYARTRVMSKFKRPEIDEYDHKTGKDIVQIRKGATIDILNGAGGYEMYKEQGKFKDYEHWQYTYARGSSGENADRYGGLFCNFNVGGNNRKAYCEFLRINSSHKLLDSFTIYQNESPRNVSYASIDENFKQEKIKAYKLANNIVDPIIDQTSNSTNSKPKDSVGGGGISDEGISTDPTKKNNTFNITILIIGSVCAAMVVVGFGLVTFKKKKINEEDDDYAKRGSDDSFNFLGYLDSYRSDDKSSVKEKGSIKDHKIDLGPTKNLKSLSEELGYIYQNPKITFDSDTGSFNDVSPLVTGKAGGKNSPRKFSEMAPLPSKPSNIKKSPSYKSNSNNASYGKTSKYDNKYY